MDEQKDILPQEDATTQQPPKRTMSKGVYYALLIIFAGVFLLSAAYVGNYFMMTGDAQQDYADLEDLYLQGNQQTIPTQPSGIPGVKPSTPQGPVMLPSLKPIYELNHDTVGYIRFDSAVGVSYPVMQSPYDEDFYLHHQFDKTPNGEVAIGCPYVPLECDVFAPSDNIMICGHYLKTGGMFAPLHKYQDQKFWEEHQTFTFDTLYEKHTYQIFAVFKTMERQFLDDGTPYGYPFHLSVNFDSKEAFDQYIRDVKGYAFDYGGYQGWPCIETDIVPQYGDKLLCVYTCEYSTRDPYTNEYDGRLVIMAVRID